MRWTPTKIWDGQDCFIIGGGPSLKNFDWSLLKSEHAIGCNNAFELGPEVCDVCFFSDEKFFNLYKGDLSKFSNLIVTNCNKLFNRTETWLKWMPRAGRGLYEEALGYNFSSGGGAINLALLFGITTIYLLGFDMCLGEDNQINWHENKLDKPDKDVFGRMTIAFRHIAKDLKKKFTNCKVINVNMHNNLEVFQYVDPDIFWAERKLKYAG